MLSWVLRILRWENEERVVVSHPGIYRVKLLGFYQIETGSDIETTHQMNKEVDHQKKYEYWVNSLQVDPVSQSCLELSVNLSECASADENQERQKIKTRLIYKKIYYRPEDAEKTQNKVKFQVVLYDPWSLIN